MSKIKEYAMTLAEKEGEYETFVDAMSGWYEPELPEYVGEVRPKQQYEENDLLPF